MQLPPKHWIGYRPGTLTAMFRVRLGFALMGAGLIAAVIAGVMTTEKHFVGVGISFGVAYSSSSAVRC